MTTTKNKSQATKPYTKAGKRFLSSLTEWLQDTRLMSEAIARLYNEHKKSGAVNFSEASWPKANKGLPLGEFKIDPVPLSQRMHDLLKNLWSTRFIFLETLWEEYLEELVKELRHTEAKIFEPFCDSDFMAEVVKGVLVDRVATVNEIKDEVAAKFAAGITRKSFPEQWNQLSKLEIGLNKKDHALIWFQKLDEYFEIRNCIIHRQGRVSTRLHTFNAQHFERDSVLEIWPSHLDFYRKRFIECVMYIESKVEGRFKNTDPGSI